MLVKACSFPTDLFTLGSGGWGGGVGVGMGRDVQFILPTVCSMFPFADVPKAKCPSGNKIWSLGSTRLEILN